MVMQPTHGDHEDPEVEKLVRDAARVTSRVTAPRRLRTNASYALQTHPSWKIAHGGRDVLSRHVAPSRHREKSRGSKNPRIERSARVAASPRPRAGDARVSSRSRRPQVNNIPRTALREVVFRAVPKTKKEPSSCIMRRGTWAVNILSKFWRDSGRSRIVRGDEHPPTGARLRGRGTAADADVDIPRGRAVDGDRDAPGRRETGTRQVDGGPGSARR